MINFSGKFENFWWAIFIGILIIVAPLVVVGFLYSQNNSCAGSIFDCLEFEIIFFGGGMLALSLPLILVFAGWEVYKFIKNKKGSAGADEKTLRR